MNDKVIYFLPRVMKMEKKIIKAKKAYYQASNPIMTDSQYDQLESQLHGLCKEHPILELVGYPIDNSYKCLTKEETIILLEKQYV